MKFFILLCIAYANTVLCGATVPLPPKDYSHIYLLPIDHTDSTKYTFQLTMPDNFYAPSSPQYQAFLSNQSTILEWVPKHETLSNWSEIVTMMKFIGYGLSAETLVTKTKNGILEHAETFHILKENTSHSAGYTESELIMAYTHKQQNELFYIKAYSGLMDCAGIQYTIRSKVSNDYKGALGVKWVKKIENWLQEHSKVVISKNNSQ